MSLRARILAAFTVLLLPMIGALGWGIRNEMRQRLTAQYEQRIESQISMIQGELEDESTEIAGRLSAFKTEIAEDNRFRLAVVDQIPEYRPYLLDYAGRAMRLMGLSMLQIQDASGRILSSGHFRNEYDSQESWLPRVLASAPGGMALARVRRPEGSMLVFARMDSVQVGTEMLSIVGGVSAQRRFLMGLAPGDELAVSLLDPGGARSTDQAVRDLLSAGDVSDSLDIESSGYLVRELAMPFALKGEGDSGTLSWARLLVTHHLGPLQDLHRRLQMWIFGALAVTAGVGLLLAIWLSHRLSRPMQELAEQTATIDLNRLDLEFPTERRDEVGVVARFLASMLHSLRTSVIRLRDAERRATLGDVARQVNHDVKNGLIPIRNVFRHLNEVHRDDPGSLPRIYGERQGTVESSLTYLERLAENYARLSPAVQARECHLNTVVRQVASAMSGEEGQVETDLAPDLPPVFADLISLRRILENLIQNGLESLPEQGGRVNITTQALDRDGTPVVRIIVEDNGSGIPRDQLSRIFDDFYTTRDQGVGLGLSIVRRLVVDCNGSIEAQSDPGQGSRFLVDLPGMKGDEA